MEIEEGEVETKEPRKGVQNAPIWKCEKHSEWEIMKGGTCYWDVIIDSIYKIT